VGFAIPVNLARIVAEQLVNFGKVERGFLGVQVQELDEELVTQFGADKGALISGFTEGSRRRRQASRPAMSSPRSTAPRFATAAISAS